MITYTPMQDIGEYHLAMRLGEGGMGQVFYALRGKDIVALKVCSEKDPDDIARFRREVRLMQSIQHDRIIKIYDAHVDESPYYFTMPLASGSLDNEVKNGIIDTDEKRIDVLLQVCQGISALHHAQNPIIHRDIKPHNVLHMSDGYVVSDLGLGRFQVRDSKTLTADSDHSIGTASYMAPEIADAGNAKNATTKCDIYSFGKLIYFVFSEGKSPQWVNPDVVPMGIYSIIKKCTEQNPVMRYSDIDEVGQQLEFWLQKKNEVLSFDDVLRNTNAPDFHQNVIAYLQRLDNDFPELLSCLHRLTPQSFEKIINGHPDRVELMCSLIKKANLEHTNNWRPFTFGHVNVLVYNMRIMAKHTKQSALRQDIIELAIIIASRTDQYRAMEIVLNMLEDLNDTQLADMSFVLSNHREDLENFCNINNYHHLSAKISKAIGIK